MAVAVVRPSAAADECFHHADDQTAERCAGMFPMPPSTAAVKAFNRA